MKQLVTYRELEEMGVTYLPIYICKRRRQNPSVRQPSRSVAPE